MIPDISLPYLEISGYTIRQWFRQKARKEDMNQDFFDRPMLKNFVLIIQGCYIYSTAYRNGPKNLKSIRCNSTIQCPGK